MRKMTGYYLTGTVTLLIPCALYSTAIEGVDLHAWRGEYAKISTETKPAACPDSSYIAVAGDTGGIGVPSEFCKDNLGCAVTSFRNNDPKRTLALTEFPEVNPWLETYRIYLRSWSLRELGMKVQERKELEEFFLNEGMIGSIRDHHLLGKLLDSFVELSLEDSGWDPMKSLNRDMWRSLSGGNLLRIFERMNARGKSPENNALLTEALKRDLDDSEELVLEKLVREIFIMEDVISKEEAVLAAKKTISCGLPEASEKMLALLPRKGVSAWQIRALKASLLEKTNDPVGAYRIYNEIFQSDASTELRKQAILRIAAIDNKADRKLESAEKYILFAKSYPDDNRAERSLDTAARLMIAGKEWEKAVQTWDIIRQKGPRTYAGKTSMLAEAVLLIRLGRMEYSTEILKELLPHADRKLEAAVCYWLYRANEGKPEAVAWQKNLEDAHPYSFYTRALGREKSYLALDMNDRISASVVDSMEALEKRKFEAIDTLKQQKFVMSDHPAWEGFKYFLQRDLFEEAGECARTLSTLFSNDSASLLNLFRETRRHGMIGMSTRLLSRYPALTNEGMMPVNLLFPVAYAGFVGVNVEINRIPPDLILGVIREESAFDPRAISRAGAAGLMQLMPSTGKWIAGKLKRQDTGSLNLHDPEFNIAAGTWYLRFLLERNGGSVVDALASYNAGGSRMSEWRKTFVPSEDPMAAIEMIGIEETREYVRRVLESMAAYRSLYLDGGRTACD